MWSIRPHEPGANTAALGLLPADVTPLMPAQGAWGAGYSAQTTASADDESARQSKDDKRRDYQAAVHHGTSIR